MKYLYKEFLIWFLNTYLYVWFLNKLPLVKILGSWFFPYMYIYIIHISICFVNIFLYALAC